LTISSRVRRTIKGVTPHALVMAIIRSQTVKRRRSDALRSVSASVNEIRNAYSYKAAIDFIGAIGLPRESAIGGSIPQLSLEFCSAALDDLLPKGVPLIGLHVGNFLGISLCHFVDYVRKKSDQSVIVSIDPNLTCMGIQDPQKHVISILNYFGLQRNAVVCVGYSNEKSISNDGNIHIDDKGLEYDPFSEYRNEESCENVLSNLCTIWEGRFDFAVVDGNHERSYLQGETSVVKRLLKPEGVLILDDVSDAWVDIKAEFDDLRSKGWRAVNADGRVGVLRSTPQ
jgi:hypothetical protein